MKIVIGGLAAVAIGAGAYFMLAGPSPAAKVVSMLQDAIGDTADVSLDGCDLRVSASNVTDVGMVQTVLRVDLRLYDFETIRTVANGERRAYVAGRETATNAMVAQARAVFAAGGDDIANMLPDDNGLRDVLNDPTGNVFTRLMAIIETDADGVMQMMPHEDGPKVHAYIASVHELPAPVSYQTTAGYIGETPTAEGLRTGEIVAVPPITLTFDTEDIAKTFGQTIYDYASRMCP